MFCPFRSSSRWSWWPSWCPTSMSLLKTTESRILSCKDFLTRTFLSYTSSLCPDKLYFTCFTWSFSNNIQYTVSVIYLFLLFVTTGIQNDLWARFVTLPNQERIWTLTVTNKSVNKPTEQGISLALFYKMALALSCFLHHITLCSLSCLN